MVYRSGSPLITISKMLTSEISIKELTATRCRILLHRSDVGLTQQKICRLSLNFTCVPRSHHFDTFRSFSIAHQHDTSIFKQNYCGFCGILSLFPLSAVLCSSLCNAGRSWMVAWTFVLLDSPRSLTSLRLLQENPTDNKTHFI